MSNDLLIASPDLAELQQAAQRVQQGGTSQFAETPFYQQIVRSYQQGAEWLFCADMEQIVASNVQADSGGHGLPPGMGDVRYLTLEHREVSGKTNATDLMFSSRRRRRRGWRPGLDRGRWTLFADAEHGDVGCDQESESIMEEMFKMIGSGDGDFTQHVAEFEAKTGVNVLNDMAAPLGGEVTMAFDGPMIPTPRWKLIVEVYDPTTLQATIAKLVDRV